MKTLLPAYKGLSVLPSRLRMPVRIQIILLFVIPLLSTVFYDLKENAHKGWALAFSFVIIINLSFVLNNYKVHPSPLVQWWNALSLPLETLLVGWWLGWEFSQGFVHLYIFSVIGFCFGMLAGAIFRKANVSRAQRLVSVALVIFFILATFMRFQEVFVDLYAYGTWENYVGMLIPILSCAIPFAQIFVSGKEEEDINMQTAPLFNALVAVVSISILVFIILPVVMKAINA